METALPLISGWLAGPRRSTSSQAFSAAGGAVGDGQCWAGGKRPQRDGGPRTQNSVPLHRPANRGWGWGRPRPRVTAVLGPAGKWDCVLGTWPEARQSRCPRHRKPRVRVSAHTATGTGFPPSSLCRSAGGPSRWLGASPLWPVTRRSGAAWQPQPLLTPHPPRAASAPRRLSRSLS